MKDLQVSKWVEAYATDTYKRQLILSWVKLATFALLAAGILALLLALSRTPMIQEFMPGSNFFRTALVIHVDLSVLVWFMACACLLWGLVDRSPPSHVEKAAQYLAITGTVMMSLAPFFGASKPLMNNYVPVLDHWWFFLSLMVLTVGIALRSVDFIYRYRKSIEPDDAALGFAMLLSSWTLIAAIAAILIAYVKIPHELEGIFYYDLLFWGGGHILQFFYTMVMLVAWVILASDCRQLVHFSKAQGMVLFSLVVAPLLLLPFIHLYPVGSDQYLVSYTNLMKYGGLCSLPLGLVIFSGYFTRTPLSSSEQVSRAALITSITLFAIGGFTGYLIDGSNTVIPAHYHGSIVGVTLAFMGLIYYLLPRFGYPLKDQSLAYWQPYIYGAGQLLHLTAMIWSGKMGIQRKVAGFEQALDALPKILSMVVMGIGGLLAVIGGILFLYVVIRAFWGGRKMGLKVASPACE